MNSEQMSVASGIDMKRIIETFWGGEVTEYRFCELLAQELKTITADDLVKHYKDAQIHKKERELILRLSFKL